MAVKKRILVKLDHQILKAYENNKLVYEFDCVTGDKDHPTEPGKFQIFRKHRTYTSKKYKVPMDYAMFFSDDGKAIHKSHVVGLSSYLKYFGIESIGSHGCVRLDEESAKKLFDWTPLHTAVEIL